MKKGKDMNMLSTCCHGDATCCLHVAGMPRGCHRDATGHLLFCFLICATRKEGDERKEEQKAKKEEHKAKNAEQQAKK